MLVLTTDGMKHLLNQKLDALAAMWVHLYKNNIDPDKYTDVDAFEEADFDGYAAIALSSFSTADLDDDDNAFTEADDVVFTQTGTVVTNDIYGYYVTDSTFAVCYFAEKVPGAAVPMNATGRQYRVTPHFTEQSIPPA